MSTTKSTHRTPAQLEKACRTYEKDLRGYEASIQKAAVDCVKRFEDNVGRYDEDGDLHTTEIDYYNTSNFVDESYGLRLLFGDGNHATLHDVYLHIVDMWSKPAVMTPDTMTQAQRACVRYALLTAIDQLHFLASADVSAETDVERIIGALLDEISNYITKDTPVNASTLRVCRSVDIKTDSEGDTTTLTLSLRQSSAVDGSLPYRYKKLINDTADRLESYRFSLLESVAAIKHMPTSDTVLFTYTMQGFTQSMERFVTAFRYFNRATWEHVSLIDENDVQWDFDELAALFEDPEG